MELRRPEIGPGFRATAHERGVDDARWRLALCLLVTAYAVYFGIYTSLRHMMFWTYAYDLGTFDQGIWLAGHTTDPFVTVRGLHLLGDHVRLFSYVLAPIYWICDDVRLLLVLQSVVIACGALFIYGIGRRELPDHPAVVFVLCTSYLLNPAVQNLNLDHAHPDAFASTFILASVYYLRNGRDAAFWIATALAMSCKEDVPLVYVALGAVLLFGRRRRLGALLLLLAGGYFFVCMHVILPHFNGVGFFRLRAGVFPGVMHHLGDPAWLLGRVLSRDAMAYLFALGLPVGFACLLSPIVLMPALPALAANLLSVPHYQRTMDYHYATSIVPFIYVAAIDTARKLGHGERLFAVTRLRGRPDGTETSALSAFVALRRTVAAHASLAGMLVFLPCAVAANLAYSKVSLAHLNHVVVLARAYANGESQRAVRAALERIPADAGVSADHSLVPQLAHRRYVYMFPNPFEPSYWGIHGENPDDPSVVDFIIVRDSVITEAGRSLIQSLVDDGDFVPAGGDQGVHLYARASRSAGEQRSSCGDLDGDGRVTVTDTARILRALATGRTCPPERCDADGNGILNPTDALRVSKRAVDRRTRMYCPRPPDAPAP